MRCVQLLFLLTNIFCHAFAKDPSATTCRPLRQEGGEDVLSESADYVLNEVGAAEGLPVTVMVPVDQIPKPHSPDDAMVYPHNHCQGGEINELGKWDFIIVGSGPSGAAVGRRLAENPKFKVLILEAGDAPPIDTDVTHHGFMLNKSQMWQYPAEYNEKYCQGFNGNKCQIKLAKLIGGGSAVNWMNYMRGSPKVFDEIGASNPGWTYEEMLPYFKKLENFSAPTKNPEVHGKGGPMTINKFDVDPHTKKMKNDFLDVLAAEYPKNDDFSSGNNIGFGLTPGFVENSGYRGSVTKAYLHHMPTNLHMCYRAVVSKLIISSKKTVVGLEFFQDSMGITRRMVVKANKEYILAAGALNTPQILERSGIGKKEILTAAKIAVKHKLEGVGENLSERLASGVAGFTLDLNNQQAPNPTAAGLWDLVGMINVADPTSTTPNVFFQWGTPLNIFKPVINQQRDNIMDWNDFPIVVSITPLVSSQKGSVHVTQDRDAEKPPVIDLGTISDKTNQIIIDGVKFIRKFFKNPALAGYIPRPTLLRECMEFDMDSDEEIACQSTILTMPTYQFSGTAKMGSPNDKTTVVGSNLKVHGISNLRITDLSVLSSVPDPMTEITAIVIAERAADIIKADWGDVSTTTSNPGKDKDETEETEKTTKKGKGSTTEAADVSTSETEEDEEESTTEGSGTTASTKERKKTTKMSKRVIKKKKAHRKA